MLFGALGVLGVVGGSVYYAAQLRAAPPKVVENHQEPPKAEKHEVAEAEVVHTELLPLSERVEGALQAGNFVKGLKLIRELEHTEPNSVDPSWLYREGLCWEGLQKWSEARERYRTALTVCDRASRSALRLGLARCQMAIGHREEAEQEIRSVAHDDASSKIHQDCLYHLAQLAYAFCEPGAKPNPLDVTAIAWPELRLPLESILTRLPVESRKQPGNPDVLLEEDQTSQSPVVKSNVKHDVIPRSQAYAAARVALEADSGHPSAMQVRLLLANANYEAGRLEQAKTEYRRIREQESSSSLLTIAAYNLGLIELQQWRLAEAREMLLDVADRNRHTKWESLAWWWIGRLELDAGQVEEATKAWWRAEGLDRNVNSAVELGRLLVDFVKGDTDEAEERFYRTKFSQDEQHKSVAAVFQAYFRHQTQPTPNRAEVLSQSIRKADHGRMFGPVGALIFGEFHVVSGHEEKCLNLYEETIPKIRGPWAHRMTFTVADRLKKSGHTKEARQRFLALEATNTGEWGDRSCFALAELDVQAGDGKRCVARCQRLLNTTTIDRTDVLRVMGRGYELLRMHRQAAECFSGQIPTLK